MGRAPGSGCAEIVGRDERPDYAHDSGLSGALRQTRVGFHSLWTDPPLRLLGSAFTILVFFEGAADVLVVVVALQLLGLAQGSVGYLNAAWGVGALVGGAVLALLFHRGNLSAGLVVGALVAGVAMALPGAWPVAVAAYAGWIGMGIGYTFVEVTARTLLQRLETVTIVAEQTTIADREMEASVHQIRIDLDGTDPAEPLRLAADWAESCIAERHLELEA